MRIVIPIIAAAVLAFVPVVASAQHQHMGHGAGEAPSATIEITTPWTRATPGGAKIAGGYFGIRNGGAAPDRLIAASTPAAGRVEIHEMTMKDGVMSMRLLPDGLTIKPGESVELKPGGLHMMLMDLKAPLKEGDSVPVTLEFEKAGKREATLAVGGVGSTAAPAHQH